MSDFEAEKRCKWNYATYYFQAVDGRYSMNEKSGVWYEWYRKFTCPSVTNMLYSDILTVCSPVFDSFKNKFIFLNLSKLTHYNSMACIVQTIAWNYGR